METSKVTTRKDRDVPNLRVEVEFEGETCFVEAEDCAPPQTHDFAALLFIFAAMRSGRGLHISGPVSKTLLRNLEEFQDIWSSWRPGAYSKVPLSADEEVSIEPVSGRRGIFAFSAGVVPPFALHAMSTGRPEVRRLIWLRRS